MTSRVLPAWVLAVGLLLGSLGRAAPPAIAQAEINYLLTFVEQSGCDFYRNGSWYDSKKAQSHLRQKFDFLAARGQINTAEDFIEKAATKSSLSGQAYQVQCSGGEAQSSNQWLRDALARYRAQGASGAPRMMRGALRSSRSASNLDVNRPS
jgi:hypothetical protein